jgi:Bacteriocin-protection, YdeI or OmpD-Associated/Domain of unknown function (DUF1905)
MKFTGVLADSGRGGTWIEVPFSGKEAFGEARAPVAGTVDGTPFRGRLSVYGGKTYLGLNREVRATAGIEVGDDVEVVIERDDEPREVDVPEDLQEALVADTRARHAFEVLSYTHRNEYSRWIAEAKKPETRERRVAEAIEMLRTGVKHP